MSNLAYNLDQYPHIQELVIVTDYETLFATLPDMVGGKDAAKILGLKGVQGVHHVLKNLTEDAPQVDVEHIDFGKRTYNRYPKVQLIALRRYRDSKGLTQG